MKKEPLIFISAADMSAEAHAVELLQAVRKQRPGARFVGVGGQKLADEGVELLVDIMAQSAMTYEAFIKIGYFLKVIHRAGQVMRQRYFDAAVYVDSPALHFPMSRKAKNQGIPNMYYIAPQVWAWARHRRWKLRWLFDKVACILPFEETLFRSYGIDATYVGSPVFDNFDNWSKTKQVDLKKGIPTLALLPGSRAHEVKALMPAMLVVARKVLQQWPDATFIVAAANEKITQTVTQMLGPNKDRFHVEHRITHQAIKASDLCLAASGTATLEVAACGRPMVVMYHVNRLLWKLVGWWLVPQRPMCLVNILAGEMVVPEFMPWYGSPAPVAQKVLDLLADPQLLKATSQRLLELTKPLKQGGTADRAARILLDLADSRTSNRRHRQPGKRPAEVVVSAQQYPETEESS